MPRAEAIHWKLKAIKDRNNIGQYQYERGAV